MSRSRKRFFPEGPLSELGDRLDLLLLFNAFPYLALADQRQSGLRFFRYMGVDRLTSAFILQPLDPDSYWVPTGKAWKKHLWLANGTISWGCEHNMRWLGPFKDTSELAALDLHFGLQFSHRHRVARLRTLAQARLSRRQALDPRELRGVELPQPPSFDEPTLVATSREVRANDVVTRWLQDRAAWREPAWYGPLALGQDLFVVPVEVARVRCVATAVGAQALRLQVADTADLPCPEMLATPESIKQFILARADIGSRLMPRSMVEAALLAARVKLLDERTRLPKRQAHSQQRFGFRLRREAEDLVARLGRILRTSDVKHSWRLAREAQLGPARRAMAWLRRHKEELVVGKSGYTEPAFTKPDTHDGLAFRAA